MTTIKKKSHSFDFILFFSSPLFIKLKGVSEILIKQFRERIFKERNEMMQLKNNIRKKQKDNIVLEFYEKRRMQAYQW